MLTSENGFPKNAFMSRGKMDRFLHNPIVNLKSLDRYSTVYL